MDGGPLPFTRWTDMAEYYTKRVIIRWVTKTSNVMVIEGSFGLGNGCTNGPWIKFGDF